jgi:flagellar biosynthetic protein FlhB
MVVCSQTGFRSISLNKPVLDILQESTIPAVLPVLITLVSILAMTTLTALGAGILQAGLMLNTKGLEPKWDRVNPASGFARIFSMESIAALIVGVAKLAVVGWVAYIAVAKVFPSAPVFWQMPADAMYPRTAEYVSSLSWTIAVPLLLLGVADYGYKKYRHEKELMMSKEELKEEQKQQDGDPHIKQRIRSIQRQRAQRRMMADVPKATVIITNPTHVAIALKYESNMGSAPIVLAKGEDAVAQRIKAVAAEHGVPIIEEPPLARALLRTTKIGVEIPAEFYRAVAEILAVIYRRKAPQLGNTGRR